MTRTQVAPEQEGRELDQLTLLYVMADHIQRARHVEHIYEEAVEGLRRAVGADRTALLVADDQGVMRFRAWSALSASYRTAVEGYSPWPPGASHPRPVVIEDAAAPESPGELRHVALEAGVRGIAFVPMLHRGRLLGTLMLARERPQGFAPEVVRLAEAIAGHLAFAIWRGRADEDQAELLRRFETERSVLESVVRQMPAGVLVADVPSGRIVMTNEHLSATWRRPFQEARAIADYAAWGGRGVDGRELAPEAWPLARSVVRGETVANEEVVIERGDGTMGVIRMSSAPVRDGRGRQLAAVATVFDVTEEKRAEGDRLVLEEATRVLNSSLEVEGTLASLARLVVGRLADWCVVYRALETGVLDRVASVHADPALDERLAAGSAASLRIEDDLSVAWVVREGKPILAADLAGEVLALMMAGDPAAYLEDPATRPTSSIVVPLVARDRALGALVGVRCGGRYQERDLVVMAELGRRAALAVDNALLYEQARAADAAKANFLAVMSHEVRTPLSAILGYADILATEMHGELSPTQRAHVGRVKASVQHLSQLVDEILSFASMEAGREKVRLEVVDLVELAGDVAGIMEPMAAASGLTLRVVLPSTPLEMEADGPKIRQILINLLANAIKYTAKGHVELVIRSEDGWIRCTVEDTGPGIPPEHVENVFEPFWQVDRGEGRRIAGTGLGLAVARRLARLMGGEVRLASAPGSGSAFTLELPVRRRPGVAGDWMP